uniref:Uncharacterized protein n=1 Tax=Oryza punctata TaxID=4537 RepID=A0A0E0KQ17_ORYPU
MVGGGSPFSLEDSADGGAPRQPRERRVAQIRTSTIGSGNEACERRERRNEASMRWGNGCYVALSRSRQHGNPRGSGRLDPAYPDEVALGDYWRRQGEGTGSSCDTGQVRQ